MEAPLSGSNDVFHNRNLDQAAPSMGKLFLISEDRLKILASLAKQVFQMCEQLYKVEIKPPENSAPVHGPSTQEPVGNAHSGGRQASAPVTSLVSGEEIVLPTCRVELRRRDKLKWSTIPSEDSIPLLEETMENTPETSVDTHDGEGDIINPGGSGDLNDVAQTQPEMMESASAKKDDDDISNEVVTQPDMKESASAMMVDGEISKESSKWQMLQVKVEHDSDIDPVNDVGVNNDAYTQPEMMDSSSDMKDKDISAEGSDWRITNVTTEQDTHSGYYIGSTLTCADLEPSDREYTPTSPGAAVTMNNGDKPSRHCNLGEQWRPHMGERPHQYPQCGWADTVISNLNRRMRTHTGEKPYKCHVCEKKFPYRSALHTHVRTHTGEKPFKCQQCEKAFAAKYNLTKHMRIHTGEKPYQCRECKNTFSQQSSLLRHMRTHTGEKPYKCKECDKTFSDQGNMNKHMVSHTGGKSYKCRECENTFCHKSSLFRHMRTHTRKQPYKC